MTIETLINQLLEIADQKGGDVEVSVTCYDVESIDQSSLPLPIQDVSAHSAYPTKESPPMVLIEM